MLFAPRIVIIIVSIIALYILIFLGEVAGMRALGVRSDGSAVAFIIGFLLAGFLCMVLYIAIVFTGASTYLTGAFAERWTKKEFLMLGPTWHFFFNVPFSVGRGDSSWIVDVDLIAVGPYGVLVVETKFSSAPIDLGDAALEKRTNDAKVQVEDNSGRVRALLQQVAPGVPIRPVIVFWGRLVKPPRTPVRRVIGRSEDVRIMHGGDAKEWRPKLTEKVVITDETMDRVAERIADYQSDFRRF
jgi:hypothetical protein